MNHVAIACLAAFVSGAAYELGCVIWVHHAEAGEARTTALWSMSNGLCQVLGIGQSIAHPVAAPFYVLGYGFGSWLGVTIAKRRAKP